MSFSFGIRAKTKHEAIAAAAEKMGEVVRQQPVHSLDATQALETVRRYVSLLPDEPEREITVSVSGYLSGTWDGSRLTHVTGANISVTVGTVAPGAPS